MLILCCERDRMRLLCHFQTRLHHGIAHSSCNIPSFLPNPKHTHMGQRVFPAEAAVEKEDEGETEERKSQMGIKCRDRSEGQHRLFKKMERLFTALHECNCIQPPDVAFKLSRDPDVCVCMSEENVLQESFILPTCFLGKQSRWLGRFIQALHRKSLKKVTHLCSSLRM